MKSTVTRRTVLKSLGVCALGAGMTRIGLRAAAAEGSLIEINSGVSFTPSAACVWRVVADTAAPAGEGEGMERALGFALANRGDLVIHTSAGGSSLVPEGSSYFVPEADFETQEGAGDALVPYIRFGLVVPGDATYTAGGELLFGSDALRFAAGGEAYVRLNEGNFSGNERVVLPATGPHGKVVYAERGSIAVVGIAGDGSETGHRFVLNSGEAVVPTVANDPPDHWEAAIAGEVEHMTFYLATAESPGGGNDASGDPSYLESGTVNVQFIGCSNGTQDKASCEAYYGGWIELENFEAGTLCTLADAVDGPNGMRSFTVPYGAYIIRYGTDYGNPATEIVIDGVTAQNPTARVDAASPVVSVSIFFPTQ